MPITPLAASPSSWCSRASARQPPALAADGDHHVALLARQADIQTLADELGDGTIAIEADVTDRHSVVAAGDRVQQELGGADITSATPTSLTAPTSTWPRTRTGMIDANCSAR